MIRRASMVTGAAVAWRSRVERWSGSTLSRKMRLALVLATTAIYVLTFNSFVEVGSRGLASLSVLPVVTTAWLFGMRAGVAAAVAVFPLNSVLLNLTDPGQGNVLLRPGGIPGTISLVLCGLTVGWLRDLLARVREQARALDHQRAHLQEQVVERLRADERLREIARLKDELVSVVSHELRGPLTSFVGFSELLLTRDCSEEQRHRILNIMLQEGRRLATFVDEFLDLQRIESGAQSIEALSSDLRAVLEDAVAAAGEDPERPIVLDLPEGLPAAQIHAGRMRQVLANLLTNARKYSPGGGAVRVTARLSGASMIEVAVSDSGLGIPAEALPRVFEKFYRVNGADREAIKGTGLGLAICRSIVEDHGGLIWVESSGPGCGTRFCFTLPLASGLPQPALHAREGQQALGSLVVLAHPSRT